nr:MAG TPA_asm: hypothetical protein [Caudoviricetes sp.]
MKSNLEFYVQTVFQAFFISKSTKADHFWSADLFCRLRIAIC